MHCSTVASLVWALSVVGVTAAPRRSITNTITGPNVPGTGTAAPTPSSAFSIPGLPAITNTLTGAVAPNVPTLPLSLSPIEPFPSSLPLIVPPKPTVPAGNLTASPSSSSTSAAGVSSPSSTSIPHSSQFEITDTNIHVVEGGNTTLQFTIHDPNPVTNETTTCLSIWNTAQEDYPTGPYQPCGASGFAWHMQNYASFTEFQIGVEHVYVDPAIGEAPYDHISNFAVANITTQNTYCVDVEQSQTCQQQPGDVIYAPITQTTARRR